MERRMTDKKLQKEFTEDPKNCNVCGEIAHTIMVSDHTHNLDVGPKILVRFEKNFMNRTGHVIYACQKCAGKSCQVGPYAFCTFCSGQLKYCPTCHKFREFDKYCDQFQISTFFCSDCKNFYTPRDLPVVKHYFG